ncbi:bacillithiol system redox-active protein YtxJ [Taibaiella sp. KBW10]|uniref:bacillithiol system redox-active protein YtxJ n=1 Tax=Taibaiella sp. KBW10 TaxID=2153357 RepID=UPI000F5B4D1F|nr:bacillithiol system redox-active protein YtxJ [Taibaiella sp. KBW10]RQO30637.1 bacillithiol system redox-active protein YtxJ [Taibaiella sp. KBW10]
MNWKPLTNIQELDLIEEQSKTQPQLIFKHSTQCNISADAEEELNKGSVDAYYLDLLAHRNISDEIARRYGVTHQSPQVLIIANGACVYHESHWRIKTPKVLEQLQNG